MQLARRLTSAFLKVVSLVVVLYSVSLLGIRLAGFEIGIVMSDSMQPALSRGDLVILQDPSTKELKVGTIIRYQKHGQLILHRIVDKHPLGFRTKGDANKGADPIIVKPKQIDSIAVGTLKGFGFPLTIVKSLFGFESNLAKFTSSFSKESKLTSSIWIDPVAKWKQIVGGGTYSFTAPSGVTSTGNGNRSILLTKNLPADKFFYSQIRLTSKDSTNASIYLNADVCLSGSTFTCGWSVGISETNQQIFIQTYSPTGTRQAPILFRPLAINLGNQSQVLLYVSSNSMRLYIDGLEVLNIPNPYAFAFSKGVNVPSGTYFGFSVVNANQFKSTKTLTW